MTTFNAKGEMTSTNNFKAFFAEERRRIEDAIRVVIQGGKPNEDTFKHVMIYMQGKANPAIVKRVIEEWP